MVNGQIDHMNQIWSVEKAEGPEFKILIEKTLNLFQDTYFF